MGLFDIFRKQRVKQRPKRDQKPMVRPPSIKTNVPLSKVDGPVTNEDILREIKALYVMLSARLDRQDELLKQSGRVITADRLFIKAEALAMLKSGTPKGDVIEFYHKKEGVPKRTLYRWLE